MRESADLINSVAKIAWPLIIAALIWKLLPQIKKIVESRGFTVKVGAAELTVQEVSEKLLKTTADIQGKLAIVSSQEQGVAPRDYLRRILWVDDWPENNYYEVAQLKSLGVEVVQVRSTSEGIETLRHASVSFDAVLSDMYRTEDGRSDHDAGIDLIRRMRERGHDEPVFVYASHQVVSRRNEILAVGGNGVTASPSVLFEMLRGVGQFPYEASE
jgi:CheY-like chemotaxis protein